MYDVRDTKRGVDPLNNPFGERGGKSVVLFPKTGLMQTSMDLEDIDELDDDDIFLVYNGSHFGAALPRAYYNRLMSMKESPKNAAAALDKAHNL